MDTAALAFTALVALATGFLFGVVPALQLARAKESEALKDSGRSVSEGIAVPPPAAFWSFPRLLLLVSCW